MKRDWAAARNAALLVVIVITWSGGASAAPSCQGTYAATSLQPLDHRQEQAQAMPISAIDRAVLAGTVALGLGLAFTASQDSAWPATAESCHDGDTCTVISDKGQRVTIRLHGVDAPKLDQPYVRRRGC